MAKYVDVVIMRAQLEVCVLRTVPLVQNYLHDVLTSVQLEPDRALIRLRPGITLDLHIHLYVIATSRRNKVRKSCIKAL
jgi:hypothetical protein